MEALSGPHDLTKNELAAEAVRCFGELRLRVTGSSMLPTVRAGDELLIHHCSVGRTNVGDIVLFMRRRRLFAHRVVSRSGACIVTQGDGVAEPDPPVTAGEFLGKVIRLTRHGKIVRHESRPTLQTRVATTLFRRSATAGRLFTLLQRLPHRALR
jgi:hypothetical protein